MLIPCIEEMRIAIATSPTCQGLNLIPKVARQGQETFQSFDLFKVKGASALNPHGNLASHHGDGTAPARN